VGDIEVGDSSHSYVADGFLNHNTISTIGALSCIWEKNPDQKVIVLTTKSSAPQWQSEFAKFTNGVQTFLCSGTALQREKVRKAYEEATGPCVLIMGYRTALQDFTHIQEYSGYILVTDEATAYKNHSTQIHRLALHLANQASKIWALTGTLIKNNLMEGYGIYKVVHPELFPKHPTTFMNEYCIVEMMSLPNVRQKIPKVVGYRKEQIKSFKDKIDPYYLGRPKHEVADELPTLTQKTIEVPLNSFQESKYQEALTGILEVGSGDNISEKEVSKLTSLIYCQQIVNHPKLIDCEGESEKLNTLIELIKEGDLEGQKVIVYTFFKKLVDIMMDTFKKEGIKAVRVTGDEKASDREKAKNKFQDPNDATQVICITKAGGDAINLQAASAIVFFDTPWSAGDYLQILGRMIRIGSVHQNVYAIHLVATGRKVTIDKKVMDVMFKKKELVEAVIGKRLKGDSEDQDVHLENSDINDLFDSMRDEALSQDTNDISLKKTKKAQEIKPKSKATSKSKKQTTMVMLEEDDDIATLLKDL
jgi:SNF2 family DNA or RNA helicase